MNMNSNLQQFLEELDKLHVNEDKLLDEHNEFVSKYVYQILFLC